MSDLKSNKENIKEAILDVELVKRQNMFGYRGDTLADFLKVTISLPRLAAACKRLMEKEVIYKPFGRFDYQFFESSVDFDIRLDLKN